ncbi:VirB8/TrbF family protein [Cupriavidus basilensis]
MAFNFFRGKKKVEATNDMVLGSAAVSAAENPYLAARREWNERYGDFIAQKLTWQKLALALLGALAVSVTGNVYQGSQSKIQPWIVEVNKMGDPVAVRPAEHGQAANNAMIAAQVARWVVAARSITNDPIVQKRWLDEVYGMSSQNTAAFLNEWYSKNDPFAVAKQGVRVVVTVQRPMPLSDKTWNVEWEEERRGQQNELVSRLRFKALVPVSVFVPETIPQLMANPSGVLIEPPSWNQQL